MPRLDGDQEVINTRSIPLDAAHAPRPPFRGAFGRPGTDSSLPLHSAISDARSAMSFVPIRLLKRAVLTASSRSRLGNSILSGAPYRAASVNERSHKRFF